MVTKKQKAFLMADYVVSIGLKDLYSSLLPKMERATFAAVRKMQSSFSNLGNGIGGVARKVTSLQGVLTGLVAGAGVKGLVDMSIKAEQTQVAFETFLGSAEKAKNTIADLNKFSTVTPFEPDQVIQAGKALTAFGVETNAMIPTLTKIGNIAAGTGKDFNELSVIYGKAKIAGTLYAEDINQLVEAGIPIMGEFAKALGTSENQVKKMASEGKLKFKDLETAFTNLTGEGGMFFNLMEKQSQTVGGRISTLVGNLKMMGMEIGNALLPSIGSAVDFLNTNLQKIKTTFGNLFNAFRPLMAAAGSMFSMFEAGKKSVDVFDIIDNAIAAVSPKIQQVANILQPIFQMIGQVFQTLYQGFVQVGGAIGEIINSIIPYIQNLTQGFQSSVNIGYILGSVFELITYAVQSLAPWIRVLFKVFTPVVRILMSLGGILLKVGAWLLKAFGKTALAAVWGIGSAIEAVVDVVGWLVEKLVSVLKWLGLISAESDKNIAKADKLDKKRAGRRGSTKTKKRASDSSPTVNTKDLLDDDKTNPLAGLNDISGALQMPKSSGAGLKTASANAAVHGDSKQSKNITVNIQTLVGNLSVMYDKGMQNVREEVGKALVEAVRDFEIAAGS